MEFAEELDRKGKGPTDPLLLPEDGGGDVLDHLKTRDLKTRRRKPFLTRRVRWQVAIFCCLFLAYFSIILCRVGTEVSLAAMTDDKELEFTKFDAGTVLAYGNGAYIVGKLLSGAIADTFGGRKVMISALTAVVFFTSLFANVYTKVFFIAIYMVNKICMSSGWPALTKLVCIWFDEEHYGKVFSGMSIASRSGGLASTFVLGGLLSAGLHWRIILFVAATVAFSMMIMSACILRESPGDLGLQTSIKKPKDDFRGGNGHPLEKARLNEALLYFARSPAFWCLGTANLFMTGCMEMQSILPLYFKDSLHLTPGHATLVASSFQAGAVASLMIGGIVYDHIGPRARFLFITSLLGVSTGCLVVLWTVPDITIPLAGVVVFVLGATISTPYYIPVCVFSMSFGGEKYCSTLSSILDVFGYCASIAMDGIMGAMSWHDLFTAQVVSCVMALLFLGIFMCTKAAR
ncbi:SLC37A1 [Branchiostoma lanceolatum]|uniref:SLC37A1 protein n=2 Tax=Branchiostoma lanceolatum TaxID=7740 RepID=A0A8J9W7Q5_BRALA|nr:SLC37A1 [Branchiostoma lanceolatum]